MIWPLTHQEQWDLVSAMYQATRLALYNPMDSEPDLIAKLVKELPNALNQVTLAPGNNLLTGGVFIHNQPKVTCANFPDPSPASVELGDLLLIRTGVHNGKVYDRRAILLQAKKTGSIPVKSVEANQHHLYAQWPTFTYVRSGPHLNGEKRNIASPDQYAGSKYFFIGTHPASACCRNPVVHFYAPRKNCQLHMADPTWPSLSAYRCFYQELLNFIIGNTGRAYTGPPPANSQGWDQLIDDLLKRIAIRSSKHSQRAGTASGQRGHGLFFRSGNLDSKSALAEYLPANNLMQGSIDIPPDNSSEVTSDDDDGGIPIMEFVVHSEGTMHE